MNIPDPQSRLLILDTTVASEKFRGSFDDARYSDIFEDRTQVLPVAVMADLLQLPLRRHWGQRQTEDLQKFISDFVILAPSRATARWWAAIRAECNRVGIATGENDTWIAAVAAETGGELVSYDRDHSRMGNVVPALRVTWLEHTAARG